MSRSILVIADQHENDRLALEKAHSIATPLNAKLEILRFLPELDAPNEIEQKQRLKQAQENLEQTIAETFSDLSQITSQVIPTAHIADWIEGTCTQKSFDLIVKSGHRTESIFHTPTDWQLIRQLSCPILFANEHKWKSKPIVMTTVDLSAKEEQHKKLNQQVLQWTSLWSNTFHCSTHVVYSIPIAKALLELDVVDQKNHLEKKRPQAEKELTSLLENFELNDVHTHITAGPPEKTIPHVANDLKPDLVIMGCVGRTGLKGFIFGNTAEKVLHHLRTDTLIVETSRL